MGTSFTFLPIAREMVVRSIADARSEGKCDGNDCRGFGKKGPRPASSAAMASTRPGAGYGQFLGTAMAAAWFEVLMLLPEDRVIDEEKEHYPRAFSDGEISYET